MGGARAGYPARGGYPACWGGYPAGGLLASYPAVPEI